ncbi:MAG: helix-turn-helix domain-containing protein [Candidatus Pristimantibacillus sp.]
MYKVMLVDDDYPVLELIAYAIDWQKHGLQLLGMHENGANAFEAALEEMPDILITDIGMPKMDGLELIRLLKERKPELRAAILSCHSEFQYAQQALKLQVRDYLLKDTLDPADISKLLLQFKEEMQEQEQSYSKKLAMEHLVDRNKALMKEKFIRKTIHQPLLDSDKWKAELQSFGLPFETWEVAIPVLGIVDDYSVAKHRFLSDDVLSFAIDNVMEEVITSEGMRSVHFVYSPQESIFVQTFPVGLKINGYDEVKRMMGDVQRRLRESLKLSMSFLIGDISKTPVQLKGSLNELLSNKTGRFYRIPGSIEKANTDMPNEGDLLAKFHDTSERLRERLLERDRAAVRPVIGEWADYAEQGRFPPDKVKDWTLKLLLDVRLKLQSTQYTRSANFMELNHHEVLSIDCISELKEWLIEHCDSAIAAAEQNVTASRRSEVAEACQYVSLHLDKKISLDEISELLYLNPSYFSRLFKKETGETFIEYVTRMKMSRAKELLDRTDASVGKICETLGYDNQSYFIKMFKTLVGVTPIEYRGLSKQSARGESTR